MKSIQHRIIVLLIVMLGVCGSALSQQVGSWKTYMAYFDAEIVVETGTLVFGVYNGSLLSYDPEYDEVITYGFSHGLSDVNITKMKYSPDHHALIIVYENSNIDIFYGANDVVNMPSIKDRENIENKEIFDIVIVDDYAYLPAGYGITVVDISRNVIKESYMLGTPVKSVCKIGDYLYAATIEGLKKGLTSLNLIDKNNWETIGSDELDYPGSFDLVEKIVLFQDQLVIQERSKIYYWDMQGQVKELWNGMVRYMTVLNDLLVTVYYNAIFFYPNFTEYKRTPYTYTSYYIDSYNSPDKYWLAMGEDGIVQIAMDMNTGVGEVEDLITGIQINSPKRNSMFYMTYTQNKLLITGGGRGIDRYKNDGLLMVLDEGKWFNFDAREIEEQVGMAAGKCRDFMTVVVDPEDSSHYFVSSWGEGIYEFQDNVCINRFDETNSPLETALGNGPEYSRVGGLAFDRNGDLYSISDQVQNGVVVFTANQQWKSYSYPPLNMEPIHSILVDRNNNKWFDKDRPGNQGVGIMVLTDDGNYYFSNRFVDQQGETVNMTTVLCLVEDQNGYIWAGTDNGPIRFSGVSDISEGRCNRIIGTDYNDDGYRLLEDVKITCMAVDGGNRIWMGTTGNGLYMVDNNSASLYVENFTTTNSLLISDNIVSLAINDRTGEVYVGTDRGLMSYQSDAVEGAPDYSDVYAYPNPINPDRQAGGVIITGLMSDSSIKITDLAGNLVSGGTSIGGMYRWNCTDMRGDTVKAGIYLVLAAQKDGSSGVATKIMVIR